MTAFRQSLAEAQKLTIGWGGSLYFVYLPSWSRYRNGARGPERERTKVLSLVAASGFRSLTYNRRLKRRRPVVLVSLPTIRSLQPAGQPDGPLTAYCHDCLRRNVRRNGCGRQVPTAMADKEVESECSRRTRGPTDKPRRGVCVRCFDRAVRGGVSEVAGRMRQKIRARGGVQATRRKSGRCRRADAEDATATRALHRCSVPVVFIHQGTVSISLTVSRKRTRVTRTRRSFLSGTTPTHISVRRASSHKDYFAGAASSNRYTDTTAHMAVSSS